MDREPTSEWLDRESALDEIYMGSLGWFVHAFAGAESMLFRLLLNKTGFLPAAGAAVLSGVRMKPAMDALNRLFETEGKALEKEALARTFKHFGEISSIRDDLLHYGAQEDDRGVVFVSNREKKHIEGRATTRNVSAGDLMNMTRDLYEIEVHLVASMFRTHPRRYKRMVALYASRLAEPWWYKPRAPVPHRNKKPSTPPSRKPPLRS